MLLLFFSRVEPVIDRLIHEHITARRPADPIYPGARVCRGRLRLLVSDVKRIAMGSVKAPQWTLAQVGGLHHWQMQRSTEILARSSTACAIPSHVGACSLVQLDSMRGARPCRRVRCGLQLHTGGAAVTHNESSLAADRPHLTSGPLHLQHLASARATSFDLPQDRRLY